MLLGTMGPAIIAAFSDGYLVYAIDTSDLAVLHALNA